MGTVQPAGNKETWAARGPAGLSGSVLPCGLIPGMCHFWNCLFLDFLLWHLWFLRLPHHRKPQTLCSSPWRFLHLASLMSSSGTEMRWKGLNVSLARCVDGINLFWFRYLPSQLDPITSTANRLQNNDLLQWNILCAGNRKIGNEGL